MNTKQDNLAIAYWICIVLNLIMLLLTIFILNGKDLFFENLTIHLLICVLLGMLSAGLQIIIFEKKLIKILFKQKSYNCFFRFVVIFILLVILANSSLFYIFNNPNFKERPIITGLFFWISNICFLEIFANINNQNLNRKRRLNENSFNYNNKKDSLLFLLLIICTSFLSAYSGLMGKKIQFLLTHKEVSFSIGHALSSGLVGILARLYFVQMKKIFISKIINNKLENYFYCWLLSLVFLLFLYDTWIGGSLLFLFIGVVYWSIILLCKKLPQEVLLSPFIVFFLIYLSGGLTLATLQDYPSDSFMKISLTNLCFWIANIYTPVLIEKVTSKCQKEPTLNPS